jgi:hypothetical protein
MKYHEFQTNSVPVQSDLVWQNDHLLGTGKTSEPMCLRTRYHKTTRTGLIQINPAAVAIQSNIRFKAVSLFPPVCLHLTIFLMSNWNIQNAVNPILSARVFIRFPTADIRLQSTSPQPSSL